MGFDQSVKADRGRLYAQGGEGSVDETLRFDITSNSLIESVTDDVVFLDAEGYIQTWNEEAKRIRGYTSDEITGKHFSIFYREEDVKAGIPGRLLREADAEGHTREEGWRVRKDGSEYWADMSLTAFGEDDEPMGYAMATRATMGHHREQNLLEQKEQLESLIASISHDLRNPLSVAQGNADLVKETGDLSRVEKITEALTRATELLDYLEQLATEGEQIQEPVPVDLDEVATAAWGNVETDSAELTIDGEVTLMADRLRLQQLLENLIKNAVEHGGSDVTVRIGPLEADGFYVEDDGPGVPEAERSEIFERGYSSVSDGSGFGLAICTQIATAHGWSIDVTEQIDGGARFEVTDANVVEHHS